MKLLPAVLGLLLVLCATTVRIDAARILAVIPIPSPSHNILGTRLMKELASRGHEVTMVSPFAAKDTKNYRTIEITGLLDEHNEFKKDILNIRKRGILSSVQHFTKMCILYTESSLNNTNVQKMLKNEQFDLVIIEAMFNDAHLGLGHHFNAPVIVLSTIGSTFIVNKYVGNPSPPSFVPELFLGYNGRMTFMERLVNTLSSWTSELMHRYYQAPLQEAMMHKYFPDAPSMDEVIRKHVALVLLNSHPSFEVAKPLVPNMVHIGGYHVAEPKELPEDLKSYLDKARTGFVLFSLGSNMQSNMLPQETKDAILKVFAQMPYKILWKFEDENLPGKPDNVMISKWLPQNDILAHPNIRLFITHGGLLSTTEAIYHGVPVVGIPIFADQETNMARSEALGIGKTVPYDTLTFETLSEAVKEVVNHKHYRTNVRERSRLMRDQPLPPMDNAMFWVEYVLRNRDLTHLKTNAIYLEWYQLYLIDVYATLAGGVILVAAVLYMAVKKLCCGKKGQKTYQQELKKKKKN